MKNMLPIFILLTVLLVASCNTATPTPLPTYTPFPTYTPYPTPTPPPQSVAVPIASPMVRATATVPITANAQCISWQEAPQNMNRLTCVRGVVYNTNLSGTTFFIDFDSTRTSFYGVSFNYTWDGLKGKCVEISGRIVDYRGRPQIIINTKDQLRFCAN